VKGLALYGFSLLIAAIAALGPAIATSEAAIAPYTALGDSYSAGEGNGPFDGSCHRAERDAYPRILADLVDYISFPDFHACTSAVTADVWKRAQPEKPKQQVQTSYVSDTDRLVTMTIGGNDLGFSTIVKTCLFKLSCTESPLAREVEQGLTTIGPKLVDAYTRIRSRMNPNGYLVVAGYPRLFTLGPAAGCQLGISRREALWISSLVDRGNARIADAVRAARQQSGNVFFVSVTGGFAGHELCTDEQWLYDIKLAFNEPTRLVQGSYHPNRSGQRAYATAIAAFLRKPGVRSALTSSRPLRSACSASSPGPGSSSRGPLRRGARPGRWSAPAPACRPAGGARP
jgi:GDSL-like Lipase/Acylhydrolase family